MNEQKQPRQEERHPAEVVEVYSRPLCREVVEVYERPLPSRLVPQQPESGKCRRRRSRRGLWIFLLVLCIILGAALAAWLWSREQDSPRDPFEHVPGESTREEIGEISIPAYPYGQGAELRVSKDRGETLSAQEIYRRVNPAVVTVMARKDEEWASVGTGVVFTEDGYILTNHHVLEGTVDCTIYLDNVHSYAAKYVAGDANSDLAVLKAELVGVPAAEFGDSEALVVGDKVYAIGNPLGYELRGTMTDGIVSAINRDVEVDGRTMNLIQTNAALNTGNSGGPLINEYGQVVGINTIKMISSYSNSVEGLGFAIPSGTIRRLVNDLLTHGEIQPEPLLGVSVWEVGDPVGNGLWGVEVVEIVPGSPADDAGVQLGDYILEAGGLDITASRDLLRARQQYHVGDEMPMTVWRGGELVELTLVLDQAATE